MRSGRSVRYADVGRPGVELALILGGLRGLLDGVVFSVQMLVGMGTLAWAFGLWGTAPAG